MKPIPSISLYLLITALLFAALDAYVGSNPIYLSKAGKIDRSYALVEKAITGPAADETLLVIGNSYVEASFLPAAWGNEAVVFAIAGMPLSDVVGIVENLPAGTPFRSLLVGLGYNYAQPIKTNRSFYEMHQTPNALRRWWYSIPLVRGRAMASTLVKEDVKCLLSTVTSTTCKLDEDEASPDRMERMELMGLTELERVATAAYVPARHDQASRLAALHRSTRQRLREYEPFTRSVSDSFRTHLERLKTAAAARGMDLYTYTAPVWSELREQMDPSFLQAFHQQIREAGLNYVDLNLSFPTDDPQWFSDATHLAQATGGFGATQCLMAAMPMQIDRSPSARTVSYTDGLEVRPAPLASLCGHTGPAYDRPAAAERDYVPSTSSAGTPMTIQAESQTAGGVVP